MTRTPIVHRGSTRTKPARRKSSIPSPVMREPQRTGWRRLSACAGIDTDIFYPEPSTPENKADAKAVCARCDVRLECLLDAFATSERFGIRGGLTPRERRTLARRMREADTRRAPAAESRPAPVSVDRARRSALVAVDCG
jgi:WhiB family redox-sensing transcriptional regulator